jgi:cation:H+ antiporter
MAGTVTWLIVFIISLAILVKSSDWFTKAAERIGLYLGMPAFLVGVTIVAIGTSLPELASSLFAVFQGATEVVVGNVVGSNIANILLKINHDLVRVDLPLLVGSAFLFAIFIFNGKFTRGEAIMSILGAIIYIAYAITTSQQRRDPEIEKEVRRVIEEKGSMPYTWTVLILSGVLLYVGAKFTIDSLLNLSVLLGIGTGILAASAVAIGTSLPELMVSISATRRGNADIAIGNILGSNIFNTFAVMGIPGLLGTLYIPWNILLFALPVMLLATLLFFFITQEREITQWEGWLLLLFYVVFIGKLFYLI